MSDHFDLVVIGSGPAGGKAATQAAYFGKRVAVVEKKPAPGGIAVSDAGIPTKTLRETAAYLTGFRHREVYGLSMSLDARMKLERLMSRTQEVVGIMTEAARGNLARMGVEFIHGSGRLTGPREVAVDTPAGTRTLSAEAILLAPGSRPKHPPNIPFDDPAVADSEKILRLSRLPKSLLVIGGGAIGCEYASIFTALGVEVLLLELGDRLLSFMDAELSRMLAELFTAQGMELRFGARIAGVARRGELIEAELAGGARVAAEHVLFAGGRIGNTEDLGLERAGVELDHNGRIKVDAHYQTNVSGIYAAGDVIGPPALASVSMEQGRVAACHAFRIHFKETVDPMPPFGVYSIPEVAMVGLTEEAARERGIDYEVGRGYFEKNTRARIAGITEGLIKLVFRRSDRVLLGVHILGDIAAELIHVGQMVAAEQRTIDYFIHATFNVPTFCEAYKYAAYDALQRLSAQTHSGLP
jgi:NAD(P) transhydrogenase